MNVERPERGILCVCFELRKKTLKLQLKTQRMHYLCEALSYDSLMTNPQAGLSLLSVSESVRVVSGIHILFYFIVFYTLSVLVTLLKIVPLTATEGTKQHFFPPCSRYIYCPMKIYTATITRFGSCVSCLGFDSGYKRFYPLKVGEKNQKI